MRVVSVDKLFYEYLCVCNNSKLLLRPLAGAKYCNQFVHNEHNVLNLH